MQGFASNAEQTTLIGHCVQEILKHVCDWLHCFFHLFAVIKNLFIFFFFFFALW